MNETLIGYMTVAVMVSLAAAFCVLLVKKWGIAEWMQVHGEKHFAELFSCDFCMSFWASLMITFAVIFVTGESSLIAVPLLSTPISRMLV